jgi:hypothetical protein
MSAVRLARIALVTALALSVACTSEGPNEPETSTPRTPSDSPTASSGISRFEGDGAPLDPGRYAFDSFTGPPITFAIGSGWIGGHTHSEFFDVQREAGGVLLGFADPTFVVGAGGVVEVEGLNAEDAVGLIAANPPFVGGAVRSGTIDGREAFEVRGMPETSVELFGGDDGTFTVEPGSVRLIAVDVGGRLMLIVGSVWLEPRDRVDRLMDGVIASVRLEGG